MADNSADIAQFVAITGASAEQAQQFLAGADLETAVQTFFAAQEPGYGGSALEAADPQGGEQANPSAGGTGASTPSAGYTMSGKPVEALPEGWGGGGSAPRVGRIGQSSGSKGKSSGGSKFGTLGGLKDDSDSEDEEEKKRNPELYTGGGRGSGLAVKGPPKEGEEGGQSRDVIAEILRKAKEAGVAPSEASGSAPSRGGAFRGSGMTLGSDETPSVAVPDPSARPSGSRRQQPGLPTRGLMSRLGFGGQAEDEDDDEPSDEEPTIRHLTFWRDGFSVEDGPLLRYDDPANKEMLDAIKSGRAPLSLLNVKHGQPVEVRVAKRMDEDYVKPPPKPMQAFSGSGNRLGSPAPEVQGSVSAAVGNMPGGFGSVNAAGSTGTAPAPLKPKFEVDPDQPSTTIQVRLADGTKLNAKMNLTHTVGDIRAFVQAAQPETRSFVIQTTFPTKVLEDDAQTIEAAGLKNAVVVQRWV